MHFVEEVETGMVHVNEPTIGGEAQLPFGGTKATGVGEREMAEEGLELLYRAKNRFYQLLGQSRAFDDPINKKAHGQKRPRAKSNPKTGASSCALERIELDAYFIDRRRALPMADVDDDVLRTDEFVFVISRARD